MSSPAGRGRNARRAVQAKGSEDYARFVGVRSALWDEFEAGLRRLESKGPSPSHADVEAVAFRYRQVLHDHSVAASRFSGTGAARRLRHLAFEGTRALYLDVATSGGLRRFATRTFPLAFRAHLPYLAVVVSLFATALALGVTLSFVEPGVGLLFLGPAADAGLREGRLWTDALVTAVPPAMRRHGAAQYAHFPPGKYEWPALVRMLDQQDPSYKT